MSIRPRTVQKGDAHALDDLTETIESQDMQERFGRSFMKTMLSYQGIGTYKGRVVAVFEEIDHGGRPMSTFYAGYDTIKNYLDAQKDNPQDHEDLFKRQADITTRGVADIALEAISERQEQTAMNRARRIMRTRLPRPH